MRFLKILLPICVLVVGVVFFQYIKSTKPVPEPLAVTPNIPVVKVQSAEPQSISPGFKLFGQIETTKLSTLSSAIEGDVVEVMAQEGNLVSKGEVILEMDDSDMVLVIKQREAEISEIEAIIENEKVRHQYNKDALAQEQVLLKLARKSVARAQKLAKTRAGSEATLDSALQMEQQQLLVVNQRRRSIEEFPSKQKQNMAREIKAKAALMQSQRDLQRTRIVAPFDGVISQSMVSPGERINRGSPVFEMYDQNGLEIRAQIPNQFISIVKQDFVGAKQTKASAIIGDKVVSLEPNRISSRVEKGQGGVNAFFTLPFNTDIQLGRTIEINVVLPPLDNVVSLPADALYGSDKVYVIEEGKLKSRKVARLGKRETEQGPSLLIDGGQFAADEQILVSRLPQATEGMAVSIQGAQGVQGAVDSE